MDDQPRYAWIFWCLVIPLLLLVVAARRRRASRGVRLPPGPWRLPVIGNLHNLMGNPLVHRAMADLAARLDAPLMYLRLGEVPVVVASSPAAAREVMKTQDVNFATRPWGPTMRIMLADGEHEGLVFARYGPLWRQLRKIAIVELLSARRVQSFRRVREDEARRLAAAVAAVPPGDAVNVTERLSLLITDSAMRSIMGDRFEKRDEFLAELDEGVKLSSGFSLGDLFPSSRLASFFGGTARRAVAHHRKNFEFIDCAIRQHEERRAAKSTDGAAMDDGAEDDLLGVLLRIQKEGSLEVPLTMENLKAVVLDLFGAGSETSANTLQWAMSELVRNPAAMERAQAEVRDRVGGRPVVTEDDLPGMTYLKLVIKETLRLHPVVPLLLPRECREACKVMGYDVPGGTTVFVNVFAIGRDPRHWDAAETFMPERFERGGGDAAVDFKGTDFELLPFGAGRRMCPGMSFAQASMELALATMLYHFDWEPPCGVSSAELDMAEEMSIIIRRKNELYLRPTTRVQPPPSPPPPPPQTVVER